MDIPLEAFDGVQQAGSRLHPPARDTARGVQSKDGQRVVLQGAATFLNSG